ncbi:hypothetical protein ACI77I_18600, partial [Pseudomonas sp. D47]|uniref:hypothetical protein n=1 Tax=Pseudomonas sp. D47 TaxID=3159447 RepID=UPI00387AEC7B
GAKAMLTSSPVQTAEYSARGYSNARSAFAGLPLDDIDTRLNCFVLKAEVGRAHGIIVNKLGLFFIQKLQEPIGVLDLSAV